eukprot:scaffold80477_cov71-Phaeocystis_antarctica.AAC.1
MCVRNVRVTGCKVGERVRPHSANPSPFPFGRRRVGDRRGRDLSEDGGAGTDVMVASRSLYTTTALLHRE